MSVGFPELSRGDGFGERGAQIHSISAEAQLVPTRPHVLCGRGPWHCPIRGQQHPRNPMLIFVAFSKENFEPSSRTAEEIWKMPQEEDK